MGRDWWFTDTLMWEQNVLLRTSSELMEPNVFLSHNHNNFGFCQRNWNEWKLHAIKIIYSQITCAISNKMTTGCYYLFICRNYFCWYCRDEYWVFFCDSKTNYGTISWFWYENIIQLYSISKSRVLFVNTQLMVNYNNVMKL